MEPAFSSYILKQIERVNRRSTVKVDFYHQNLEKLPVELFELDNLEELNLKKNNLSVLPKEISLLKNLKVLILDDNNLSELPEEIGQLQKLICLSVKGNKLVNLPTSLSQLISLRILNVSDNELVSLSRDLDVLERLEELQIYGNKFTEIPQIIYNLKELKSFYYVPNPGKNIFSKNLDSNSADHITKEICQLEHIETFEVYPNNFRFPPPEIVSRGVSDIQKFFLQIEAEGVDFLFEAKLLIVGEPGAGKTSLARKIIDINAPLPEDLETTKGIKIDKLQFKTHENHNFLMNIWDFGGQEIYHSTHQFFLTKRSLYVLVCDTRKEDTSYNYWLQVIELLSDSSPLPS